MEGGVMSKAGILRKLLEASGIVVLPGAYDCVGAKLIEKLGFEVVFTSGFGISGATLGKPDFGLLTATEVLYSVGRMADAVSIPLVADIDTGYGNPLNVYRTVSDLRRLDVAGFILEDQLWPKKCGHFAGKRVIPTEEHVEKIRAAVEARGDSGMVIIGRTDARAPLGLDEAIERGHAYRDAGADVVFVEAPQSVDELRTIADAFPGTPLFANMVEGGKTPLLTAAELEGLGYKIVVFPLSGLFAATSAMAACFEHLKAHGTTDGFDIGAVTFGDFEELIGVPAFRERERRFGLEPPVG